MTDFVNQNEFCIVGMSRSGNHAIINWMLAQMPGHVVFLNCAEPKTNPYQTARPMAQGSPFWTNAPGFELAKERSGSFSAKDALLISYEDCYLGLLVRGAFEENHDEFVGSSAHRRHILILRDPFNLFASRLRSGYSEIPHFTSVKMWKQHAREFLTQRRYLPRDRLAISYNRWVAEVDYRREIAAELGLTFTDAGFDSVAQTGEGSSFDKLEYDGRASQMQVFDRWRAFANDPTYLDLFDSEVIDLSEAIFGPLPAVESLPVVR